MSDARLLAQALQGVSSSNEMPRWREYARRIEALDVPEQGGPDATFAHLAALPAGEPARARAPRLVAALASFTDDYTSEPPHELLPGDAAARWLAALAPGKPLDLVGQLRLALDVTSSRFDAVLVCHLATRTIARGRDTRVHPSLALGLDERLHLAGALRRLPDDWSRGGDAPGDTYHYWAQFAAGYYAAGAPALTRSAVLGLFATSPLAMRVVRSGVFRRTLFYGTHARVDRKALVHGYREGTRSAGADVAG